MHQLSSIQHLDLRPFCCNIILCKRDGMGDMSIEHLVKTMSQVALVADISRAGLPCSRCRPNTAVSFAAKPGPARLTQTRSALT